MVLFTPGVLQYRNARNRSTTDGTKVGVRGTKTISSRLFSAVDVGDFGTYPAIAGKTTIFDGKSLSRIIVVSPSEVFPSEMADFC